MKMLLRDFHDGDFVLHEVGRNGKKKLCGDPVFCYSRWFHSIDIVSFPKSIFSIKATNLHQRVEKALDNVQKEMQESLFVVKM